jgi:hypothetical protein
MMVVSSRNRLPATPTQNQEEYSGTERIYETRSAARVKRGSEAIHSSFPRGGSFKHNKGHVRSKVKGPTSSKGKNILYSLLFGCLFKVILNKEINEEEDTMYLKHIIYKTLFHVGACEMEYRTQTVRLCQSSKFKTSILS